jgi:hypothetical protein
MEEGGRMRKREFVAEPLQRRESRRQDLLGVDPV